jgi:signal transduction histidine kinase
MRKGIHAKTGENFSHTAHEEHFDDFIAQMTRAFVREPADKIRDEVDEWLRRLVVRFGLDRSTVVEVDRVTGSASFSHCWAREGDQVIRQSLDPKTLLPWFKKKMLAEEIIVYSKLDELPNEAQREMVRLGRLMPKSNVTIPIKFGGVVLGAVGFGTIFRERHWTKTDLRQLQEVAEILGYALERARTERELLQLRDEMTYLSRVNTMGELAASLAHELNQPLTAILSNSEAIQAMLQNGCPNIAEITEAIADIIHDDLRAGETIRRLRSMFRREQLKKDVLDLGDVLLEVGRLVQHDAQIHGVTFGLEVDRPLPVIRGDRIQLQQAIINLVLNAFETVAAGDSHPREVQLRAANGGADGVSVLVRDSGRGIEPGLLQRIFDPFFTTKPGGLGIGLAITRTIVEGHEGRLSVAPNPDRGVTFKLTLPAEASHSD